MGVVDELATVAEDAWKVLQRNVNTGKFTRTLLEGLEDDCMTFISQHFPRIHTEPGSPELPTPDAIIVSPDGDHYAYHGPGVGYVKVADDGQPEDAEGDDDDDEIVVKKPAVRKTAAKKPAAKKAAPSFNGGNK